MLAARQRLLPIWVADAAGGAVEAEIRHQTFAISALAAPRGISFAAGAAGHASTGISLGMVSLVAHCATFVLPPARVAPPVVLHRHATVAMHDYAAQFAKQQSDQRAARMRRLEEEILSTDEAASGTAPPAKAKGGFTGGVKADDPNLQSDGTPKKLNYDESVTQSWESSDVPDFLPEAGHYAYL